MGHMYSREFYHIDGKALVYPKGTPRKLYTIGFPPYGRLIKIMVQESQIADPYTPIMGNYTVRVYDRDWAVNAAATLGSAMPITVGTVFNVPLSSGLPVGGGSFYGDIYWTMGGLAVNPAYPSYGSGMVFYGSGYGVGASGKNFGTFPALAPVPGGLTQPNYGSYPAIKALNQTSAASGAYFGDAMYGTTPRITSQYQGQIGAMMNVLFTATSINTCTISALGTLAMSGDLTPSGWATGLPLPTISGMAPATDALYSPPGKITVATTTNSYSIYNPGTLYISYLPVTGASPVNAAQAYTVVDESWAQASINSDTVNTLANTTASAYGVAKWYSAHGIPYMNREGSFATPKRQVYLEIDATPGAYASMVGDARFDVELVCEPTGFTS